MNTATSAAGPTLSHILQQGTARLQSSSSARRDAEVLLCSVLACERAYLYFAGDKPLSASALLAYEACLARRASGEPVAYITGQREFWSLNLHINAHTLIPRPDTECVVEECLTLVDRDALTRIADIGTGSGAIALAVAHERKTCHVHAVDISAEACAVARMNARHLGLTNITVHCGDWLQPLTGMTLDIIVSNPPYLAAHDLHLHHGDLRFEPQTALVGGDDGLKALRHIVATARPYLHPGGWLVLEHGFTQAPAVTQMLLDAGYGAVSTRSDYAGLPRVTLGRLAPI